MRLLSGLLFAAGAAILFLGCGSTEEVTQQPQAQVVSPTATVTPAPTAVVTPAPTPAATAAPIDVPALGTPIPVNENGAIVAPPSRDSLPPTPADWVTMSDPLLRGLMFRHPPDWFVSSEGGKVLSFDPATTKDPHHIPAGGVILDFDWAPPDGAGVSKPVDATDTTLAGAPGWERVKVFGPSLRAHTAKVSANDLVYVLTALFGDGDADETVFLQILESVQIADWP